MTTAIFPTPESPTAAPSSGGTLVTRDGRDFVLRRSNLRAQATGGLAHVVLEQRFLNPYDEPLHVGYTLPLPSDGAISGFAFAVAGKRTVGEVDRRAQARERFEDAILEGHSAALLDQERTSVFTQEIGNIPPRSELVVEISIDQRLRWLAEGQWEWRFPTVVAPRYMGASGRVADVESVTVEVDETAGPTGPTALLALSIDDVVQAAGPESPSHDLWVSREDAGVEVGFQADSGAALDRDVVVRWPVARSEVAAEVRSHGPAAGHARAGDAFGLLSVTPPRDLERFGASVPRDLIFLIDTSGSMHGEPIAQAARIATAMIETLGDGDRLELIEFSDRPRPWKPAAVPATASNRRAAIDWLGRLRSGGATEMRDGILQALAPLSAESQRQVVLITDGMIGFECEIVEAIATRLPASSRVHTIGVGHAPNRSLTEAAARAGRGFEAIVAPGEDAARAAHRMVEHTAAPLLVDFRLSGAVLRDHVPAALPDLFAGCPALIPLRLDPAGGELVLQARGAHGDWTQWLTVPASEPASGNRALASCYAREAVEDLEVERAAGRGSAELDARVEELGLAFQIATRMTSWIAVSEEQTVDPNEPTRKEKIPQAVPAGMSLDQLGLRDTQAQLVRRVLRSADRGPAQLLGTPRAEQRRTTRSGKDRGRRSFEPIGAPPEDFVEAYDPPAFPQEPAKLVARLVRRSDSSLVLEIELDQPVAWKPKSAKVMLADGSAITATIDRRSSTRKGKMKPGQVLRLVLALDARLTAPVLRIELEQKRRPTLQLEVV